MGDLSIGILTGVIGVFGTIVGALIVTTSHRSISREAQVSRFRLAALEKRLAVHQEAYTLWNELFWNIHKESEVNEVVMKCQDWWYKNCLYLDAKSRKAFREAYHLASDFRSIPKTDTAMRKEWFEDIRGAGAAIVEAVELPTIGEHEGKRLEG